MNRKLRNLTEQFVFSGLVCVAVFCAVCSPVYAYVPTGSQILDHVTARLGKARDLKLTQKTVLYDEQLEGGRSVIKETAFYLAPELFRSEISSNDTTKIHLASFDQALVVIDNKIVSEFESGFDHYKDLFAFKDRMVLQKRLQLLGIDTAITRLDRLNGKVVYVLGKKETFGDIYPQLYVAKESFLPVKWVLRGTTLFGEESDTMEVLFFKWRKHGNVVLPARMEFYKNHVLVREINVKKVEVNKGVDAKLFDFDTVRAEYQTSDPSESDVTEEKDTTRKVIEGLDKIIKNDPLAF